MLRAARARFALTLARAKIYSNTGALPQPPSGETRSPEPLCAAGYVRAISVFTKNKFHAKVFPLSPLTQYILVPLCSATHRLHPAFFRLLLPLPPPSRQRSALRPRSSRGRSLRFSLCLCLFRYPTSSGRRCVLFSSIFIAKLRRVVRSFPSADPALPSSRLRYYRLSPIKRLAAFRRARFMHRKIRRQTHYRLQRKFDRTNKCAFKNL